MSEIAIAVLLLLAVVLTVIGERKRSRGVTERAGDVATVEDAGCENPGPETKASTSMSTALPYTHPDPGRLDLRVKVVHTSVHIIPGMGDRARVHAAPAAAADRFTIAVDRGVLTVTEAESETDATVITNTSIVCRGNNNAIAVGGNVNIQAGGSITIDGKVVRPGGLAGSRPVTLTIELPAGSDAIVFTATGKVTIEPPLCRVRVRTGTGAIRVASARTADLRTGTANIVLGSAEAALLKADVGDVTVSSVGDVTAKIGVGSINVLDVSGPADLSTDVGNIAVTYSGPESPRTRAGVGHVHKARAARLDSTP